MMTVQYPGDPRDPKSLRRAGPLIASNGKPDKDLFVDRGGAPGPPLSGIGTTFKHSLQSFRDRSVPGRSSSLRTHKSSSSTADQEPLRPEHSQSLSDVQAAGEMQALQALGAKSTPRRGRALSMVSESLTSQHSIAEPPSTVLNDVKTLQKLHRGTLLTKVSAKKHKSLLFRLEADLGQIVWVSKTQKIVPIESIKEIRSGDDARYNREHFQLAKEYQDRWLTIIYILDGNYKTLHLIAPDHETFRMWDRVLRELHSIRKELMHGLGNGEMRQAIWEKQYWKAADEEPDHMLTFTEIEGLCKKLNINSTQEDLLRLFKQADNRKRDYLDFDDFQHFVKLLKARPEIERIYKKLCAGNERNFDFGIFEKFMREKQKSTLDQDHLRTMFNKYTCSSSPKSPDEHATAMPRSPPTPSTMSLDGFTSFLLSPDNSAFIDQHRGVSQIMTRPLSEYYISSSHNTYLVGHQLVGSSSTEGYIRALLHGCRSVEVDIYDGETEPMVFHGKTLTSKVSLREVCKAIMKYGFSTSQYPIIISAEVHCSVPQQDHIASIMIEEFGESLVKMPPEGIGKIETLPSPEDLKGKILLKAKNQDLIRADSLDSETLFSEISSSASDSEAFLEMTKDIPPLSSQSDSTVKAQFTKAGTNLIRHARTIGSKPPPVLKNQHHSQSVSSVTVESAYPTSAHSGPPSPTHRPPARPNILQRARRSLRSSSSSVSATDASSALSEIRAPSILKRIKIAKSSPFPSTSSPSLTPSSTTSSSSGINLNDPQESIPPSPGRTVFIPRNHAAQPTPTPETVLSQSPPPMTGPELLTNPRQPGVLSRASSTASRRRHSDVEGRPKPKMSLHLLALLVYTVGVKCRGINKKEEYAPEHMFSLSEKTANKMLRFGMWDLIKHTKTHLVRIYPKGTRVSSTNYEPHRFWAAGAQLVALNWQTFDLGYMINYAMFQRNGRSGYVLKPDAIRLGQKDMLTKRKYNFNVKVISGQQLPRSKDTSGREGGERQVVDPYVEVTLFIPDWPVIPDLKKENAISPQPDNIHLNGGLISPSRVSVNDISSSTASRSVVGRTSTVKKNGFNPVWEQDLCLPFHCVGEMMDLIFVRFMVKQDVKDADEPLAVYCSSLGSLLQGYRHLPLHDTQMSQYLFSTLFVHININPVNPAA